GDLEGDTGFHGLETLVEVIDRDLQKFPVGDRRQRFFRLPRQIRHHPHDERELDLLVRAVELDVVLDLHPRRPIPGDEFLAAAHLGSLVSPERGTPPASPNATALAPSRPRASSPPAQRRDGSSGPIIHTPGVIKNYFPRRNRTARQ